MSVTPSHLFSGVHHHGWQDIHTVSCLLFLSPNSLLSLSILHISGFPSFCKSVCLCVASGECFCFGPMTLPEKTSQVSQVSLSISQSVSQSSQSTIQPSLILSSENIRKRHRWTRHAIRRQLKQLPHSHPRGSVPLPLRCCAMQSRLDNRQSLPCLGRARDSGWQ